MKRERNQKQRHDSPQKPSRLLRLLLLALYCNAPLLHAEPLTFQSLSNQVRTRNLAIQSAREKWEAARARIPQAGAWEDPQVGVDVERMGTTRLFTFTDNEWMVSQTIPIWGKNRSKARAAAAEAEVAFQQLRRTEWDALARARSAYFKFAAAYGRLDIYRRNADLLNQITETTRSGYEAGSQSQGDLLNAETERMKLEQTKHEIEAEVAMQEAELNSLMNQPSQAHLDRPEPLAYIPFDLKFEQASGQLLSFRPEIQLARNQHAAENARLEFAHRDWRPDPQFRVEARQYNGGSEFIREYDTGIFFSLPWANYSKYSAAVQEARRNVRSAQLNLGSAEVEAKGMLRERFARIEQYSKVYLLYRDKLTPLASLTVQALRSEYEAGKSGVFPLLSARRNLQDLENTALEQLMNYQVAIAELESLIGRDLHAASPGKKKKRSSKD